MIRIHYRVVLLLTLAVIFVSCSSPEQPEGIAAEYSYDLSNQQREFAFSNKKSGFYIGETNNYNHETYQGWTVDGSRILKDYQVYIGDDTLDRKTAETLYFPHKLVRKFAKGREEFFFADNVNLIWIQITRFEHNDIFIRFDGIQSNGDYNFQNNVVSLPTRTGNIIFGSTREINFVNSKDDSIELVFKESDSLSVFIMADSDEDHLRDYIERRTEIYYAKLNRINDLLNRSFVNTNNPEFDLALAWAKVHLNALGCERDYTGIIAGLPNLDDFWGRDILTAIPGAMLYTGDVMSAKDLLAQFSKLQNNNFADPAFGRIPNRFSRMTKIYDAADVTPLFVVNVLSTYKFSGDLNFLKKLFPAVKKSVEINIAQNCDSDNFLVHGEDETWMNSEGDNGLAAPRGTRAVEIQARWYEQLTAAIEIAHILGKTELAEKWQKFKKDFELNFQNRFIDRTRGLVIDNLDNRGNPDTAMRPNAFFALNHSGLFPDYKTRLNLIAHLFHNLVLPYGPTTISLNNPQFHPYYENRPLYLKEEAFHNGMIWYWNFGQIISTLSGFGQSDLAWQLTENLVNQMNNQGIPGAISEFSAPFSKTGERKLRGSKIHAMALAEFVRNFYEDYLGVYPNAPENTLYLIPALPEELTSAEFIQRVGDQYVRIKYQFNDLVERVFLYPEETFSLMNIALSLTNRSDANYQLVVKLNSSDELLVEIPTYSTKLNDLKLSRNGVIENTTAQIYIDPHENKELYSNIKFADAILPRNQFTNTTTDFEKLSLAEIKSTSDSSEVLISQSDATGDENYLYPLNPAFKRGILDLTQFELKQDSLFYYFDLRYKNLVDPGWRPEYGFQLTFTSILIQCPDFPRNNLDPGYNSKYLLSEERKFSREIIIGGGLEVLDASGNILAAYLPEEDDRTSPLGNISNNSISFALPRRLLGNLTGETIISILVGAQQDFGTAGIGNFRNVNKNRSEWYGGGKSNPENHNIYDFLLIN